MGNHTLLEAALEYAGRGLFVFPLKPRDKTPLTAHGHKDATVDQAIIKAWWRKWPQANIGIRCNGLLVPDFDGYLGAESYNHMIADHGKLPSTWTVKTGGGTEREPKEQGLHMVFKAPVSLNIRPGAGKYGYQNLDFRANDSYIVAPPSVTRLPYETIDSSPIADAPGWLIEIAKAGSNGSKPQSRPITELKDGQRHADLISFIGKWRHRGFTEDEIIVQALALSHDSDSPLSDDEVIEMVREYEHQAKVDTMASKVQSPGMLPLATWRLKIESQPATIDLIQDVLPCGSTEHMMIAGRAGIGKTNLVLGMAFCLATETPWFSHKTQRCRVGYLAFEGQQRKLLARFDKLQKSFPDPGDNLLIAREVPFKLSGKGIDRFLKLCDGLDVVIIDPIRYIVAGDYTKPEYASAFITTLRQCCAKTKTIPILLHHVRKPDRRLSIKPEDLINEVKGAGDYVEAAGTVVLFERARQARAKDGRFGSNEDDRILHFCKVKDSPDELRPLNLRLNRDTLIYQPLASEYEDESESDQAQDGDF